MTDTQQEKSPRCETCGRDLTGLSYYEGVYPTHGPGGPTTKQFCAIPCLTKHAYNNTETVELPGGLSDE